MKAQLMRFVLALLALAGAIAPAEQTRAAVPPYPQPALFDKIGKFIGLVFTPSSIVVNVTGQTVELRYTYAGLTAQTNQPNFYFLQTKCVGTRYLSATYMPVAGTIVGANLFYAGPSPAQLTYKSYNYYDSAQKKVVCVDTTYSTVLAVAKTATLASLGLTGLQLPFSVKLK